MLGLFCSFSFVSELEARKPAGVGRYSFEAAYRNEKANPEKAARLYHKALREGLNAELRKAANWRLFYLYRDMGAYDRALKVLPRIASGKRRDKLRGSLVSRAARRLQVDREAAEFFIKGLALLDPEDSTRSQAGLNYFAQALQRKPGSVALQNAIRKASQEAGLSDQALSLYTNRRSSTTENENEQTKVSCEGVDCDISRVSLQLSAGRLSQARHDLQKLAEAPSLSQTQKAKILYLMAKHARESDQPEEAVRYYRVAMRYGDARSRMRMRVLSSFGLYQKGYKRQARILAGNATRSTMNRDFSVQVYYLLLKAEVDRDAAAKRKLKSLQADINRRYKKGYAKSLMKAALDFLDA